MKDEKKSAGRKALGLTEKRKVGLIVKWTDEEVKAVQQRAEIVGKPVSRYIRDKVLRTGDVCPASGKSVDQESIIDGEQGRTFVCPRCKRTLNIKDGSFKAPRHLVAEP